MGLPNVLTQSEQLRRELLSGAESIEQINHREMINYKNTGNITHRNNIVIINLPFVVKMAKQYSSTKVANRDNTLFDEYVQQGTLGLIGAIEKFDLSKNNNVCTYLCRGVKIKLYCHYRDERRRKQYLSDLTDEDGYNYFDRECAESYIPNVELPNKLIKKMSTYRKKIIKLHVEDGLSFREIGEMFHKTRQAISGVYHSALRDLRNNLDKHGYQPYN